MKNKTLVELKQELLNSFYSQRNKLLYKNILPRIALISELGFQMLRSTEADGCYYLDKLDKNNFIAGYISGLPIIIVETLNQQNLIEVR
jgi:hypothetical protein